ncbi:MAG TPA: FAD-dependent oxidoreductase [Ktedonobacteraceae bacterium]|jgi:phytoene dehydrogenase-like protein|nr:FAD-dependent oxidoreductase [Ktedonobacteraceae bacterium]
MQEQTFDAIVIGGGLGGLLSAAQLLQRGKRVVVLERLPHCGGRFTAKTFQGTQVSTGAVHMIPFGSSGVLARMLRRLQVPHRFFDADVFGSFHVHGKQIRARGLLGLFKVFGPRQFFWFTRVGYLMFLRRLPPHERNLPFDLWLERHIDTSRNPELTAFFERISRFALSLELHQVSTAEVINTTKNMFRYGAPGIVEGGCGALTAALECHILEQGAQVRLRHDVLQIVHDEGKITGVRVRSKATGEEYMLSASLVISDIGPRATHALLSNRQITQTAVLKKQLISAGEPVGTQFNTSGIDAGSVSAQVAGDGDFEDFPEAVGLKVHVLSDVSLIPHKGIMYCLDTQRIAGIVQPTNCDPSLAPPGKHLLISHQVIQSTTIEEEKELALADLRMMFGEAFEKHCRVLTMSAYRGEWPVNRIAQGADVTPKTSVQGLYLVGDAVKPSGYLMVEGVAQSVNSFLDLLDSRDDENAAGYGSRAQHRSRNVIPPPSRFKAIRWLWEAPGNS